MYGSLIKAKEPSDTSMLTTHAALMDELKLQKVMHTFVFLLLLIRLLATLNFKLEFVIHHASKLGYL